MAKVVSFQFEGLKELNDRLHKIRADVAGRIARAATAAGAKVVAKAARDAAPKDTGNLKAAIVSRYNRRSRLTSAHTIGYRVARAKDVKAGKAGTGEKGKDAFYARFVELGTVKMPPRPFLAPALANNTKEATQAVADRIRKRLNKMGA